MVRRTLVAAALAAGALILEGAVAAGCGDKFVLLGRGARVARARFPSTILIFMNPSSRIPAADREFRIEAVLRAAGHKAQVAETEAEIDKALASGKYDLVLADPSDTGPLRRKAEALASGPAVLPILYKPTAAELALAEKNALCQVRPSKQSRDLLVVVDQTMANRRKGAAPACEVPPAP